MLIILVDTKIFLPENMLGSNVKSILDEIRNCPRSPGHEAVLVPGQWEKAHAEKLKTEGILG